MLSKKTRYAIMALTKLAREKALGHEFTFIADVAESEMIPKRFLENILQELKKLGYVNSRLGKSGGYCLIVDANDITLSDVFRAFEGPIAMMPCVSEKSYQPCEFCKDEQSCKIRKTFKEIRDTSYEILKRTTIASLM
ncbi:RrF2 family transcriptional regulator [Alistipes sp. ZOR0009]|jgi:Rrf2 family protein|uniref:RrF2 family transcriptional regulator n=1 Tax=Alistipes sp. ZOR0009 TaxID=1339253 RepID=UPI0006480498|nr:Rrf2 family transcriptional regulator [Alistipes sp. ZOR0009]